MNGAGTGAAAAARLCRGVIQVEYFAGWSFYPEIVFGGIAEGVPGVSGGAAGDIPRRRDQHCFSGSGCFLVQPAGYPVAGLHIPFGNIVGAGSCGSVILLNDGNGTISV